MFTTLPTAFQSYLLPALPFRSHNHSRHSSTASTTSTTSTASTTSSTIADPTSTTAPIPRPTPHPTNPTTTSTISCSKCHAHLALTTQIISKGFTGRHGRAYLVSGFSPPSSSLYPSLLHPQNHTQPGALANTHAHKPVPRHLVTGAHTVSDVSCAVCGVVVGWKYVGASEEAQRYKVGKFILESRRTVVGACWEELGGGSEVTSRRDRSGGDRLGMGAGKRQEEEVVFDSQDEDECEDLFAGQWSVGLAKRRRARRLGSRR